MRFIKNYNRMLSLCMVACGLWMCFVSAFAYTAQFHAGAGLVNGKSSDAISEASDGAGVVMPTPTLAGCEGWEFAGWIASGAPYGPTDELTQEIHRAGELYRLSSISEEFYAVYRYKTDRYCAIYVNDQLITGSQYIVVNDVDFEGTIWDRSGIFPVKRNYSIHYPIIYPSADGISGVSIKDAYTTWNSGYLEINSSNQLTEAQRQSILYVLSETDQPNHHWSMYNPYTNYYLDLSNLRGISSYNDNADAVLTRSDWNKFTLQHKTQSSYIGFYEDPYNDENFHRDWFVLRQQTIFTSNPDCSASNYTVTLNPGTKGDVTPSSITESDFHAGVVLPAATLHPSECTNQWEFAGWTESGSEIKESTLPNRVWLAGEVYYPERNETLNAVYRRKSTMWEQVDDPNMLQAGEKILVAYKNGSDYYVLSSAESSAGYNASVPVSGSEIATLKIAACVWQLEGERGAWRLKDANGKHLDMTRDDYAYSYTYPWSRWSDEFTISGVTDFSIRSNYASLNYLTANGTRFSSTGTANSNVHLFRQVTMYALVPSCETYTVRFNSGEGTFDGEKNETVVINGVSAATGISLSDPSVPVAVAPEDCEEWKFAGWRVGSGLTSTTAGPGILYKTTGTFVPLRDSMTLYAVYQNGNADIYYEKVTNKNEITDDGVYLIVSTSNTKAVTYNNNNSQWTGTSVTISDNKIADNASVTAQMKWYYDGTKFYRTRGNDTYYLAYNNNASYAGAVTNTNASYKLQYTSGGTTYYLRWRPSGWFSTYNYFYYDTSTDNSDFNIFKQKFSSSSEFNSWPHCSEFRLVLNACGGQFDGNKDTIHVTETSAGTAILLSGKTPTTSCASDGWSLVGWVEKKPVQARNTEPVGMYAVNASYHPKQDMDQLYAVYSNGTLWSSYPACGEGIEIVAWAPDSIIVETYVLTGVPKINGVNGRANGDGTYTLSYDVASNPCVPILIEWGTTHQIFQTPMLVNSYTRISAVTSAVTNCSTCDMVILNGGTAVVNKTDQRVHDLTVYPGGRLVLEAGKTFTANSLTMRADGDELAPSALIQGTFNCSTLNHERRIDNARKYWMALPYDVTIANINFANPTANAKNAVYDSDFYLQYYDGVSRAADKGAKKSYWVHIGDITDETYQAKTILNAGRGYLVSLPRSRQAGTGHVHRTLRFPMTVTSWASESSINKTVVAAGADCDWPQHVGWNLIGNPFLQNYSAVSANDVQCGQLTKFYNDQDQWVEPWYELEEGTTAVPYITLYDPATGEYTQEELVGQNIHPFSAAFVQLPSGVSGLHFAGTAISKNTAPARRMGLMNSSDETSRFRIMANGKESDQFTLILNDQYTAAYEVGGDLMKMKNENKLNIYTIHEGTEHAFDALSYADGEMIPVGFTQPAAGEIIIQARKLQQGEDIKHLWLIDNETNAWTDLLSDSYVFTSEAGTYNGRLWLRIEKENKITTPITAIGINETDQARKFMYDGQLFIHRGDKLYNAVGTLVK